MRAQAEAPDFGFMSPGDVEQATWELYQLTGIEDEDRYPAAEKRLLREIWKTGKARKRFWEDVIRSSAAQADYTLFFRN